MPTKNDFMRQPVDLTKNGQCSGCAGCCSSMIPVTEQELAEMKAYADKIGFKPELPGKPDDDIVYIMCPFLQPKTVLSVRQPCAIYPARPAICRAFICNKSNQAIAKAYARIMNGKNPPKSVNVWKAYNKTGLRQNGVEISYDDAEVALLEDDDGRKIQFQVGQPLNITLMSGRYIHNAMCIKIFDNGIQVADSDGITAIAYDDIQTIHV